MSGQKKLNRAIRNNRVVAMPSKKKEVPILDRDGQNVLDKDGKPQVETIQLYKNQEVEVNECLTY